MSVSVVGSVLQEHRAVSIIGGAQRRGGCSLLGLGGVAHELVLLGDGLELAVTNLRGSIDELDLELEVVPRLGGLEQRLADGNLSLARAHDGTAEEHEVLVDNTVVGEAAERGDVLGIRIGLGGSVV